MEWIHHYSSMVERVLVFYAVSCFRSSLSQARAIGPPCFPAFALVYHYSFGLPTENSRPSNYRHYSHSHSHLSHSLTLHLYLLVPSQCLWPSWNLSQVEVKIVMYWRLPSPWSRGSCSGRRVPAGESHSCSLQPNFFNLGRDM